MAKEYTYVRPRARVLIAEDDLAFAERCRSTLEPEFEVVGIAVDKWQLMEFAAELKPDVVVIDISMTEMNGFEAGERLKALRLATKTIYMTMAPEFGLAAEALRRGASGFVDKTGFPEELRVAIRWAIRGDLRLSPSILKRCDLSPSPWI
jgi:DNA-binding NarL/FixJ family response regulator